MTDQMDVEEDQDKTRICFEVLQQAGIAHPINNEKEAKEFMVPILSGPHPPDVYDQVKNWADVVQFFYGVNVLSVSLQSNIMTSLYNLHMIEDLSKKIPFVLDENGTAKMTFQHWIGRKGLTAPMAAHEGGGVTLMIGDACGTCVCI